MAQVLEEGHGVFLIARVRPHSTPPDHPGNRRCIAALHHPSCHGHLAVRATRRFVTLLGQPENAAVVRAEVRAIHGTEYGSDGMKEPYYPRDDYFWPCPFTAVLMAMAWTANLDDGGRIYSGGTTTEDYLRDAGMSCWGAAPRDGLSILDVTDPEKPTYCFFTGAEIPGSPVDARTYLSAYYDLGESVDEGTFAPASDAQDNATAGRKRKQREFWLKCIQDLADVPLLPLSLLREAWPDVGFENPPQSSAQSQATQDSPTAFDVLDGVVRSLADISLDVSVKQSMEDGDTIEVEQILWLPGKAARVKALLRELDPFEDVAVNLLAMTLEELKVTSRVDLSGFRLSGAHVSMGLAHPHLRFVRSVDLSNNDMVVADDIPDIIVATPTLRRVVLMGCPSVDGARLLELLRTQPSRFRTIEGIIHPALLTIKEPDPYPFPFTYISVLSPGSPGRYACVSLPFFIAAQIVQALTDVIPWQAGIHSETMGGRYAYPCVGTSAFQGGTRDSGQTVNERTVMTVPLQSPGIQRGQKELWTFFCNIPQFALKNGKQHWGFVHFTHDDDSDASDAVENGHYPDVGTGKLYDLKGFLECMAKEGRPMPSDEAVEKLEKILYLKDADGQYCCPLMKQETVSQIDPDGKRRGSLRYTY